MSNIIYMKDILLKNSNENKKRTGRPKLKPFEQRTTKRTTASRKTAKPQKTPTLQSSLTERNQSENKKC